MGENISQKPNIYSFFPPEKSSLINSHLLLSKVPFLFPIKYHFSSNHPILSFICSCGHCCCINFFKLQGLEFRLFPLSSSFMLFGKLCFSLLLCFPLFLLLTLWNFNWPHSSWDLVACVPIKYNTFQIGVSKSDESLYLMP